MPPLPRRTHTKVRRMFLHALATPLLLSGWLLGAGTNQALGTGLEAQPLAARSQASGKTLFTQVPAEESGLKADNAYADPRMWGARYHESGVGAIGTGVAIADYDGDGLPDVFIVSKTESCRLFKNLGNLRFKDVTEDAGVGDASGEWKGGAAFADVNNDGYSDLHVCRHAAPNLLFINQGNGRYKEEAAARGVAVVDASSQAAFCDYDRDGWLDFYLQTNLLDPAGKPDGQRDLLFRNQGDGRFVNETDRAGIKGATQGHSATWWDYDEDGWPDLHVANDFAAPDTLYRNNRDGTFTNTLASVVPHAPFSSMGADLGDVDNDGRLDLFVADMAATILTKDLRGMADSRARAKDHPDGSGSLPQYSRNVLYVSTGTGRFLELAHLAGLAATDWTWSPRFEDLDNDGRVDLHVTTGMNREQTNTDLLDRMMLAENPAERVRLMKASPVLEEENLAYRNMGDFRFEPVGAAWGLDQKGVSFGSAFADLDQDGDLDLVYVNYQGNPSLLRNDSQEGHRLIVSLRGTQSNRQGVGAKVEIETAHGRQIRQLVLARGYHSTSEPILHFGLGTDKQLRRLRVIWPSGVRQEFSDLAGDQRLVITEPRQAAPSPAEPRPPALLQEASAGLGLSVRTTEEAGDQTLAQALLPFRFNRRGPALAVADLDADGREEVFVAGSPRTPLRVFKAQAPGGFSGTDIARTAPAIPVSDGPFLCFDANADGREDLLVTKASAFLPEGAPPLQAELLLGDGRGNFQAAPAGSLPDLALCAGALAAVDFNHDGLLDLFVGGRLAPGKYPQPARSALLINRAGRFEDQTDTLAPGLARTGLVCSALWTDLDNDGWTDLVLALEWGGVQYWHNQQGKGFEDRSQAAGFDSGGKGWWSSLAAADFNGDGRMDIVAGNLGLNTPYRASDKEPALLFAGDFKGGGGTQLVEAAYENGVLHPLRTRKDLGSKIPQVLRQAPKNDAYAVMPLEELLGREKLNAARRYEATQFASGVFLSGPDGRLHFSPLPRLAQASPVQGLLATDLDADGHTDLCLVQNSYAPIPYTGRFDGGLGLWLKGDGKGGFQAVPADQSGLVVPGNAKALVTADLDGDDWPDLLCSRSQDTCLAFLNRGVPENRPLAVRLQGRPGNLRAAGARLELELANGSRQSTEVRLGGGHFSQDSATVHFGHPASTEPRTLKIRWPDGQETSHPLPPQSTRLVFQQPAPR